MSDDILYKNDVTATQVKSLFADLVDQEVMIVGRMPEEGTGHIDLWAKLLSDQVILVNDLELSTIATHPERQPELLKIRDFLLHWQGEFAKRGFTVVTIPLPVPVYNGESEQALFHSYTNSLLVNGTILVPRYKQPIAELGIASEWISEEKDYVMPGGATSGMCPGRDDPLKYYDHCLTLDYEKRVQETLESIDYQNGKKYQVIWVEADKMVWFDGAVHCSTMEVPAAASVFLE